MLIYSLGTETLLRYFCKFCKILRYHAREDDILPVLKDTLAESHNEININTIKCNYVQNDYINNLY